jgi:hypothetical protein
MKLQLAELHDKCVRSCVGKELLRNIKLKIFKLKPGDKKLFCKLHISSHNKRETSTFIAAYNKYPEDRSTLKYT